MARPYSPGRARNVACSVVERTPGARSGSLGSQRLGIGERSRTWRDNAWFSIARTSPRYIRTVASYGTVPPLVRGTQLGTAVDGGADPAVRSGPDAGWQVNMTLSAPLVTTVAVKVGTNGGVPPDGTS